MPKPVLQNQLPVAVRFTGGGQWLARQGLDNTLTLTAQLANLLPECCVRTVGHPDATRRQLDLSTPQGHQGFQIGGKTGGRTRTTEVGADIVITTALGDGLANTGTNTANTTPVW